MLAEVPVPDYADFGPDLGPPQPIENLVVVHGWTLTPDSPKVFKNTAGFIERGFGIRTSVPAMPNTDNPVPQEWEERIDEEVTDPASTILVTHSLAGINGLRYIAKKKAEDPQFQLGGFVALASNLTPVGFEELEPHFDPRYDYFASLVFMAAKSVRQVALLYGGHDPFVHAGHGMMLAYALDSRIYIDPKEAHFSGEYRNDEEGVYVPPCTFSTTLAFIVSKMIMNVAPEGRYAPTYEFTLPTHDMMPSDEDRLHGLGMITVNDYNRSK